MTYISWFGRGLHGRARLGILARTGNLFSGLSRFKLALFITYYAEFNITAYCSN